MVAYCKNGRWYFRFQIKGKRHHQACPEAVTKRDAEKLEAVYKAALLQNKINPTENIGTTPFNELVEKYRHFAQFSKLSYKKEISRINHLLNFFGSMRLTEITPILIEKYRAERKQYITPRGKLLSNISVNREISLLSKILGIGVESDLLLSNPCRKIKKLREETRKEFILTPEQEEKMLNLCTGKLEYMKAVIVFALNTACRKAEIQNLKFENVNLEAGYITITKTKSGHDRKIPISSKLRPYLIKLYLQRKSEYVFVNQQTGRPYNGFTGFQVIRDKLELKGLRFHDLRHIASTRLVSSGIDLIVVQNLLGHSTVTMTMRYAHPVEARKLDAVEALANFKSVI